MNYTSLLSSKTSNKWQEIGIQRRAGVALPLFSVYSSNSIGIGEIPDLRIVIDWCIQNGMSILQLLPLNEVGTDFSPYNAISTFAIDPMYLSLKRLRKVELKLFRKELSQLKKKFPKGTGHVNYDIKNGKVKLLKKIFETTDSNGLIKFNKFVDENIKWLKYYSVFRILTELNDGSHWIDWDFKYKYISSLAVEKILQTYSDDSKFYCWIQWQLHEQLISIKRYAKQKGVLIMGDFPFLVSRNSADVWAYKNYFKLDLSSGAPPDMYFAKGQKWGMPPYNWINIEADNYGYLKERLRYAENFFDLIRIDHFVGLFRVWTIDLNTPEELGGLHGKFDPPENHLWENHGRKILDVMIDSSKLLPCAEDLGTVPECSDRVLQEYGITGINVQRWEKKLDINYNFIPAEKYRINSAATVSTHDSSLFPVWWQFEAGTIDAVAFEQLCEKQGITKEQSNKIIDNLFLENDSDKTRLSWKKKITNIYLLLEILGLKYDQAVEISEMYLSSYGEKNKFLNYIGLDSNFEEGVSEKLIQSSLHKINETASIFSIQLLPEYLYLDADILRNYSGWNFRINFPGTMDKKNWSIVFPLALEELKDFKKNYTIKDIIEKSHRAVNH